MATRELKDTKSTIDRSFRPPAAVSSLARTLGRISPPLAARAAEALFLRPPRFARPRREWRWLENAEAVRLPYGDQELPGWSWGTGPTVLLVHGWAGRGSQLGAFAEPLVRRGFRVVAYDAPGHGAAPGRRSSLPEFAAAVRSVGEDLWPLRGLVAHSLGTAATLVALSGGLVVERLVFLAPPAEMSYFTEGFVRLVGFPRETARGLERRLEKRFGFDWSDLQPLQLARSMTPPPALFFHDEEDPEVPFEQAERLAAAWRGSRLEATHGLGHRGLLRDRSVVERAAEFLARPVERRSELSAETELPPVAMTR